MPIARCLRPALAAALGLVAAAPLVMAAAAGGGPTGDDLGSCGSNVKVRSDGWAAISAPDYAPGEGDDTITSFAAPHGEKRLVHVTNGTVVKSSDDAGCKWNHIYPTPGSTTVPVSSTTITELVSPGGKVLWMTAVETLGNGQQRPHVLKTTDATAARGNTSTEPFEPLDDGLPLLGTPVHLYASPLDPETVFVLIDEPVDAESPTATVRNIYRLTADETLALAGNRRIVWEKVPRLAGFGEIGGLAVSPTDSRVVWAWSGSNIALSRDSGLTWNDGKVDGEITTVTVDGANGAVFTKVPDGAQLLRMSNATTVVAREPLPIAPTSAEPGKRAGVFVISGPDGTFGFDHRAMRWVDIGPRGVTFGRVQFAPSQLAPIVLGQTPEALFRFDLFAPENFIMDAAGNVPWRPLPGDDGGLEEPVLTPDRPVVTVKPGQIKDVKFDFGTPPKPSDLDVYFLVDTTMSMATAIEGLRTNVVQIAEHVQQRTRGKACFGVGEVKDFSLSNPLQGAAAVTAYQRQQPIVCEGPDLPLLRDGLARLKQAGGDNVPEEAQTVGLVQAVTGKGSTNPPVLAGQQAGFRSPMKVIVLITDAGFKMAPQYSGFPSMDETVETLNSYGVKAVGVVVHTMNSAGPAVRDTSELAARTNTFAPMNGVDCDGDGFVNVPNGEPLVCETENQAPLIAPAIVALLLGVKDPGGIALRTDDPENVIRSLSGPEGATVTNDEVRATVNMRVENHLPVTAKVTCTKAQDGKDLVAEITTTIRDEAAVRGELLVKCRSTPIVPPKKVVPPPVEPPLLPIDPIIPPKIAFVPIVMPQFNPPPPNNPPGNLNPNAGLSQEEEQQFQIATVQQGAQENEAQPGEEEVELAMTGLSHDDAAAATLVLGCAGMVSAAAGAALFHRRRTQRSLRPAYNRIHRY